MNKKIFIAVLILLITSTFFAQVKDSVNSNSNIIKNTKHLEYKNPFIAGMLSFFTLGLSAGQFYNDEYINGGIRAAISAVCIIAFAVSPPFVLINDVGGKKDEEKNGNAIKTVSILVFTVNWIMSIVDASYTANDYNKKLREKNNSKFEYGLNFGKNMGLKFSYRF